MSFYLRRTHFNGAAVFLSNNGTWREWNDLAKYGGKAQMVKMWKTERAAFLAADRQAARYKGVTITVMREAPAGDVEHGVHRAL